MKTRVFSLGAFAVACMAAGCSSAGHMPPMRAPQLPMPKSISPALVKAAPMAKTAILPSSAMHAPRRTAIAIEPPSWSQVPGTASDAAAAPDASLWVLSDQPAGADKYIWHYANGAWSNISGLADHLAVAPDGTLYATNSSGGVYAYSAGSWSALGGGASAISVASDGSVYVISNAGSGDQGIWHYTSGSWTQVPGAGVALASSWDANAHTTTAGTLAAGGTYVLNSQGSIWYQNPDRSYVQLTGAATALAPTKSGGVFALGYPRNSGGESIYYDDLDSSGWSALSGTAASITTDGSTLYAVNAAGAIYSSPITPSPAPSSTPAFSFAQIGGEDEYIALGPDGNVWYTEANNTGVGKVTPSGSVTEYTIGEGTGITSGPNNDVWVIAGPPMGAPESVFELSTSGAIVAQYPLPSEYGTGITEGPDGNLWIVEGSKIAKMTPSGDFTEYAISSGGSYAADIASGPDGNLWFTDQMANAIGKITTAGTVTEYAIPTANSSPIAITAGGDGNVWFTEDGGNAVGKITPAGTITEYPLPVGAPGGPWGITKGPDGNVWFSATGTPTAIDMITPSGTITQHTLPSGHGAFARIVTGSDGALWFNAEGPAPDQYSPPTWEIGRFAP